MEAIADTKSAITLFDRAKYSDTKYSFSIVSIIIYAFLPVMNKSLHAVLTKIYISKGDPPSMSPLLKSTTQSLTVLTSTVWSPSTLNKHQWMSTGAIFFCMKNSVPHLCFLCTSMSGTCQTPLLPPVSQPQNVTEYWWEGSASTAIPPTLASDVVGQHNKIGGITFEAALI